MTPTTTVSRQAGPPAPRPGKRVRRVHLLSQATDHALCAPTRYARLDLTLRPDRVTCTRCLRRLAEAGQAGGPR